MADFTIQITGRKVELGQALQTRVSEGLEEIVEKFIGRAVEAVVTVSKERHEFHADFNIHLPSGISLQAEGVGPEAPIAVEDAFEKLAKRIRRHKRRLRNHHNTNKTSILSMDDAAYNVIAPFDDGEDDIEDDPTIGANGAANPVVIAEKTVPLKTMTVSDAVFQLEVQNSPALMFRNAAHGGFAMVYRRADGHIGWVDHKAPAA